MRLQILGDPRLMAQLQEVWSFHTTLFSNGKWKYIDLKTISLRLNPSWQQRHNQILLVLQNYLDIRVKGSTMRH